MNKEFLKAALRSGCDYMSFIGQPMYYDGFFYVDRGDYYGLPQIELIKLYDLYKISR